MPKITHRFAVLGLSRFGYRAATGLYDAGASVIAIDRDDTVVQRIAQQVTKAYQADALDLDVVEHLGAFDVDTVILGMRRAFEAAVLLAHHIRENTKVGRIIAQVDTEHKGAALRVLGVDEVILPESDIAERLVKRLTLPSVVDRIPLSDSAAVIEFEVPESFVGKSLAALGVRRRFGVHVIGIKRRDSGAEQDTLHVAPTPDQEFRPKDRMLVLGETTDLERFAREAVEG